MNDWITFFSAITGASATLTGLVFVGISINLKKIIENKALPDRALESLILLLNILLISSLMLIPGQTSEKVRIILIGFGAFGWGVLFYLDIRIWRNSGKQYRKHAIRNLIFSQMAIIPFIVAGIIVLQIGYSGITWLISGIVLSFLKAIVDVWVLSVEIHR